MSSNPVRPFDFNAAYTTFPRFASSASLKKSTISRALYWDVTQLMWLRSLTAMSVPSALMMYASPVCRKRIPLMRSLSM